MRSLPIPITFLLSAVVLACGESLAEPDANPVEQQTVVPKVAPAGGPNLVVELKGTAVGEFRTIDGVQMDCFDVDLVDLGTGRVIGHGTDCLDLGSIQGDPTVGGFAINNTQFFHLPGGSTKTRIRTTIQPVVDASSPGFTHITGDAPGGPNILEATRRFKRLEGGVVRLSGAADMSQFFSNNIITFSCIFVLSAP